MLYIIVYIYNEFIYLFFIQLQRCTTDKYMVVFTYLNFETVLLTVEHFLPTGIENG